MARGTEWGIEKGANAAERSMPLLLEENWNAGEARRAPLRTFLTVSIARRRNVRYIVSHSPVFASAKEARFKAVRNTKYFVGSP